MKKIIIVLLSTVFLTTIACEVQYGTVDEDNIIVQEMTDYDFENDIIEKYKLETIHDIIKWVAFYIKYTPDGEKDYEQTPEETYNRKNEDGKMLGDCEDHGGMVGYLAGQIGIKTEIVISYDVKASEKAGENKYHALVYVPEEDIFIEAVEGEYVSYETIQKDFPIIHSIPWEEYIWMVYNYHELVGEYNL